MLNEAVMGMMLQWLGHVSFKISYAGDADLTEEMKTVSEVNVALLPVGGTIRRTRLKQQRQQNISSQK